MALRNISAVPLHSWQGMGRDHISRASARELIHERVGAVLRAVLQILARNDGAQVGIINH